MNMTSKNGGSNLRIQERLGVEYRHALISVPFDMPAVRDMNSGRVYAVQEAPAMARDSVEADSVRLAGVGHLAGGDTLKFEPCQQTPADSDIGVDRSAENIVINNGGLALCLPADGLYEPPIPGPVLKMKRDGSWFGSTRIVGIDQLTRIETEIESHGPAFIQWKTTIRWGSDAGLSFRARWMARADTILIEERINDDTDAWVEWRPFRENPTVPFARGGGESPGPMERLHPLEYEKASGGVSGHRLLRRMGHIGYFNQWRLCWAGFVPEEHGYDHFCGVFSAAGGCWERRGYTAPEVWQDASGSAYVRFPVREGSRCYGIVISDRESAGLDDDESRTILNRRKVQYSDLPLDKVRRWDLSPPDDPSFPHLLRLSDLNRMGERLCRDPQIGRALEKALDEEKLQRDMLVIAAYWKENRDLLRSAVERMKTEAEEFFAELAEGGYEKVCIFDGRRAKRLAYDFELCWMAGVMEKEEYENIGRMLLALAYIYPDPDYTRYADFWPQSEPREGIYDAMKDEMGDCPVPPNFAAEFFSTTGVVAELFPEHPMHSRWREWSTKMTEQFLDKFFEDDGSYAESVNYHTHCFNELLCHLVPLKHRGGKDFFDDPRVKGSFQSTIDIQTPRLSDTVRMSEGFYDVEGDRITRVWADAASDCRAAMPANGNSGGHGYQHQTRAELMVGAALYREKNPKLAGELAWTWRQTGKLVIDQVHPALTLSMLDPAISPQKPPVQSCWRRSQFVVSRAELEDDEQMWCLFRAGKATHHMDFDQGNLQLMYRDRTLLGDYGYHAQDDEGNGLACGSTWLHNTLTYGEDRRFTSGYTGLERAPEPLKVHLGQDFDWVVHRIVNDNYRDMDDLSYTDQIPCPVTVHLRHYLMVKPHYVLLWDVLEQSDGDAMLWLHPMQDMRQLAESAFQAGETSEPHLRVHFLRPDPPEIRENRKVGPLWSFGVRVPEGGEAMTLLVPQVGKGAVKAELEASRALRVVGREIDHRVILPQAGEVDALPEIGRPGILK